jgi:exopolyphosphatase / guanosine-5'-triphosphate,3'-diphosphate pyrophosphatase
MAKDNILRFAAVDIGSNAMRLLLANVIETENEPVFKKTELYRFPLRLGEDSFLNGYLSESVIDDLCRVLTAYRLFIEAYHVIDYRVCATSAMREATNREEVVKRVKKISGLTIDVIDGGYEAEIIFLNHIEESLDKNGTYLYIDVGGGSTELTLFAKGKRAISRSFNVGTIRMMHDKIDKETWNEFKTAVRELSSGYDGVIGIGSGGNINKIVKMAGRKDNKSVSFEKLKELQLQVSELSYEERISKLKLNPDRADVIVPAFKIFISVMKNAKMDQIFVPQVGLADGLVHQMYEEYNNKIKVY